MTIVSFETYQCLFNLIGIIDASLHSSLPALGIGAASFASRGQGAGNGEQGTGSRERSGFWERGERAKI